MENDFGIDPLYGLDKAIKTKLVKLGLSSLVAVRSAVESGELRGVAGICNGSRLKTVGLVINAVFSSN